MTTRLDVDQVHEGDVTAALYGLGVGLKVASVALLAGLLMGTWWPGPILAVVRLIRDLVRLVWGLLVHAISSGGTR